MSRRKKQQIKLNNLEALQGLMQETYNDACIQISDVQKTINELSNSVTPEDVDDVTKIAREKTNAYKVKDSAIKVKLEVAKVLHDMIKHNGSIEEVEASRSVSGDAPSLDDFKDIREYLKNREEK